MFTSNTTVAIAAVNVTTETCQFSVYPVYATPGMLNNNPPSLRAGSDTADRLSFGLLVWLVIDMNKTKLKQCSTFSVCGPYDNFSQCLIETSNAIEEVSRSYAVHMLIVDRNMVWKLGKLQSAYNVLMLGRSSPCTNLLFFRLLIFKQHG